MNIFWRIGALFFVVNFFYWAYFYPVHTIEVGGVTLWTNQSELLKAQTHMILSIIFAFIFSYFQRKDNP